MNDAQAQEAARRFFNANGSLNYGVGNILGQNSLSETLRVLAEHTRLAAEPKSTTTLKHQPERA